ncbi:hypothetical protein N8772_04580 [Rickettsiales bacterium]|nr:hypothetical protein [Rickettsiales bacterium]
MQEITQTISEDTIDIFVPIAIKKRGGAAMLMMPKNVKPEDQKTYFDDKLIKTISKAYKWKMEMEEGKFESLADIARKEKVGTSYVSKVFNLNFISPKIIKKILTGTQPRTLRLQDIIAKQIPDLWEEQEEVLGF